MSKTDLLNNLYDEYREAFKENEVVLGDGNPDAKLILIGEAPGKDEVRLAKPFVGMAGKNLSEFLSLLGVEREAIYITNAIKYRLSLVNPDTGRVVNRPAKNEEIKNNRRYLIDEINIINPQYIVTLGNVPLRSVTDDMAASVGKVHGAVNNINIESRSYKLYPLYHPASIIYNKSLKDVYISDIQSFKEIMSHEG
jgi:uracil-DNA glycosylase